jgi:hypothetical protein
MEPFAPPVIEAKQELKINYVIHTKVVFAFDGWIRFEGSQERMFFGEDCKLDVGDRVKITFEKEPHTDAQP